MNGHVTVGGPAQPSALGNNNPTSQHGRPGSIGCTSVPKPTRAADSPAHYSLGQQQIQFGGDLERQRIAVDHLHLAADMLDQRRVIGVLGGWKV